MVLCDSFNIPIVFLVDVPGFLIGVEGDLYGTVREVELLDWVREQWKFAGIEALKFQMRRDIAYAVERAATLSSRPIAKIA